MATPPPVIEQGQFDDAPIDHPGSFRQGYGYIDETPPEQYESGELESSEQDDTDESDDDFAQVEDEDWEIAERGRPSRSTLPYLLI
jgi:hypothetical protein